MAREKPDPSPQEPPESPVEGTTEGQEKALPEPWATCCGVTFYSEQAYNGHTKKHAPKAIPRTPATGVDDDGGEYNNVRELKKRKAELAFKVDIGELEARLARTSKPQDDNGSKTDVLIGKVVEQQGKMIEQQTEILKEFRDGHGRQPAVDPVQQFSAMASAFKDIAQASAPRGAYQERLGDSANSSLAVEVRALREKVDAKLVDDAVSKATGPLYAAMNELQKSIASRPPTTGDIDKVVVGGGLDLIRVELESINRKTDAGFSALSPLIRKLAGESAPPQRIDAVDITAALAEEDDVSRANKIAEAMDRVDPAKLKRVKEAG